MVGCRLIIRWLGNLAIRWFDDLKIWNLRFEIKNWTLKSEHWALLIVDLVIWWFENSRFEIKNWALNTKHWALLIVDLMIWKFEIWDLKLKTEH